MQAHHTINFRACWLNLPVVLGKNLHCPEETLNRHSPGRAGGVKLAGGGGHGGGVPALYISIS